MAEVPSNNPLSEVEEVRRKLDELGADTKDNLPIDPVAEKQATDIKNLFAAATADSPSGNSSSENERRLPWIGNTGCLVFIIFFVFGIIVLLDWQGYLPLFKRSPNLQKTPTTAKLAEVERAYFLIANRQNKLYYFDQQRQGIIEIPLPSAISDGATGTALISTPVTPIPRGAAKMIPTINKLVPSSDREKVALIANNDKYRSHILVLDFAKLENQTEFLTRWTEKLPPGYSVRTHDSAAWSPDNQALAFVASKEDQPDLFIATSKDQVQRVTYHGKHISSVLWLDSQRLAFVANLEGQDQMYIVHRNWGVKELSQ